MKTTRYFDAMRQREDRCDIQFAWIEQALQSPLAEEIQANGRVRRRARTDAAGGRYLRIVVLPDGETVHNAFPDRRSKP